MANNTYLVSSPMVPPFLTISAVTNATKGIVTVVETNNYIVGQLAYFSIPFTYGMFQLNSLTGEIDSISGQTFTMNIDTSQFDAFVIPSAGVTIAKPATLCSAGSRNQYNTQYVPFHSLDGSTGN